MSISEATKLRAPGVEIQLGDERVALKFDFEALCLLEEEFGGLDEIVKELNRAGWSKRRLHNLRFILRAALSHTGKADELVKLLAFRDVISYLVALTEAFNQAMPDGEEDTSPNARGSRVGSRGNGSISRRRSASAVQTVSSGE